tara:strand:+ start:546 stop:851 length:306 start_codon:yes stop_codon:yes gene_type:complete
MAKIINVSINLNKIDKTKLIKGAKGTYLNLNVAINDEKDQYDNDCSAWVNQTKEEREAKEAKNYLGNGKVVWSNEGAVLDSQPSKKNATKNTADLEMDLPF